MSFAADGEMDPEYSVEYEPTQTKIESNVQSLYPSHHK